MTQTGITDTAWPIAVLGAAGLTGRPLVAELERRGVPVRAVVRREAQAEAFRDARVADLANVEEVTAAIKDARVICYIPPSFNDREIVFAKTLIEAADRAMVQRFVYHSVLHAPTPAMPHHARKATVELMLRESSLAWTIVQPAMYSQTCLTFLNKEAHTYTPPYAVDKLFNPIDLPDLTDAIANILIGEDHEYATYELAGAERLTPVEMAKIIEIELGRPILFRQADTEKFAAARAAFKQFNPLQTAELAAMYRHYGGFGLPGNDRVLRMLLGREPASFADAVRRFNAPSR
jgi:NAD(P)H dehydrogenase (quinone)